MSEENPIPAEPTEDGAESDAPLTRPTLRLSVRWQIIVLVAGVLMLIGAGLLAIFASRGPSRPSIQYSETQVYTEAILGEPLWVNPLLATSQADRDLVRLVFSGLTRVDEYGQPVADLAERWEVSTDGLTYTFYLRPNVTWHDGTAFTAEDVAFTMSLLRDDDYPGPADLGAFWRTIETYADDDQTIRFVLTQPIAAFPEYAGIGILPAHLWAGVDPAALLNDPLNLAPVGTGPLRWEAISEEGGYTLVRLKAYPDFYVPSRRVALDGVDLHFYRDVNAAFRALGSSVQGVGGLTDAQLLAVFSGPGFNVYTSRLPLYAAILFNQQAATRLPFFQDETVRQALAMALDREDMVMEALPRQALLADSTILPGTWAFNPTLTPLPYDPTAASAGLDEAGWVLEGGTRAREGVPMSFTLMVANGPVERALGQLIVDQWRALGVDVTLQPLDAAQLLEKLSSPPGEQGRDFDAALVEFSQGRLADPDPYPFWHEAQIAEGQNYSGFIDRDLSEMLEIARKDRNGVRRAELYRHYQQAFIDRAAAILLYNPVYHYAVSCQVQGVQMTILVDPSDRFRNLSTWRIIPPEQVEEYCPE